MKLLARVSGLNVRPAPYADVLRLQEYLHSLLRMQAAEAEGRAGPGGSGGSGGSGECVGGARSLSEHERHPHDYVLTLQHDHTYTVGKRGREDDFKHSLEGLETLLGVRPEIARVPRGGETTYHGPGQLVVYPIVNLRRLRLGARVFVESLEDAMIDTAAEYGVSARGRVPGKTGVWVGDRKIGAIGVAISGGVSRHGLAFNVSPDLSAFDHIVACGEETARVTSLERECGHDVDLVEAGVRLRARVMQRLWRHVGGDSIVTGGAGPAAVAGLEVEEIGDVWDVMRELGIVGADASSSLSS